MYADRLVKEWTCIPLETFTEVLNLRQSHPSGCHTCPRAGHRQVCQHRLALVLPNQKWQGIPWFASSR